MFLTSELNHPGITIPSSGKIKLSFQCHVLGFKTFFLTAERDDSIYNKMTGLVEERRAVGVVYLNFRK